MPCLNRHRLTCGNNEYLSKFVFYKNGAGKISYEYSCCGMTNSPTSSPTDAPSPAPGTPTFMPTLEPTFDPTFMPTINGTNSTLLGAVEGGSILVGVIFSMLAAMTLALSMNIQSYALSAPLDEGIYAACSCLNRNRLWTIGLRPASFDGNALPCLLRDVRVKMGILILLPAIAEGSWCVSGRSLLPIGWLHARRFETQVFKVPARW